VRVALALVVGALAARLMVVSGRGLLDSAALKRPNYRGRAVTTAGGVYVVLAVVLVEAGRSLLGAFDVGDEHGYDLSRLLVIVACTGFGMVGLVDDVFGTEDRGFRGHVRALTEGRLTTGVLKVVGVTAVALVIVGTGNGSSGADFVADAAVIALAANVANLFDRAPGRAIKVGLCAYVPIAVAAGANALGVAVAPVIGAFIGLFGDDLRERLMLGDTGAYVLGGVLGLAVVTESGTVVRNVVLVLLVALTVAAEFVSFSRVIDRTPPLRRLDMLGRRPGP
jgi:UDP-N-acetylmuramyl pentapeptide phosphotransferase/UDP-N-acetylglucosamine-1-phosphate transferase